MPDKGHKKGRTHHSVLEDVPPPKYSHHHKKGAMVFGVAFSMIIIAGLYAASFRYADLTKTAKGDTPRWAAIQEEFLSEANPLTDDFFSLKDTLSGVLNAQKVKAASIDILRERIESGTSTESTTSTPETQPET